MSPLKFHSLFLALGFIVQHCSTSLVMERRRNIRELFRGFNLLSLPLQSAAQSPQKNPNVGQSAEHDAQALEFLTCEWWVTERGSQQVNEDRDTAERYHEDQPHKLPVPPSRRVRGRRPWRSRRRARNPRPVHYQVLMTISQRMFQRVHFIF